MDAEAVRARRHEISAVDRCVVGVNVALVGPGYAGGELLDRLEADTRERRELDEAVDDVLDAAGQSLEVPGMVDREDVEAAESVVLRALLPSFDRRSSVFNVSDAVEDEQGTPLDGDVTGVAERWEDVLVEPVGPALAVALGDENLGVEAVPASRPVLIGPAQREREVDRRIVQQVAQRRVKELPPVEPVVVHDKSVDAVFPGQRRLAAHNLGIRQVVPTELARLRRLRMSLVDGPGALGVEPIGKPASPPGVVLRDLMELRKIEGEHLRPAGRPPPHTAQPRGDVGSVDDVEPGCLSGHSDEALERVRGRAVDVTRFGLEMLAPKPKIGEPAEDPRARPIHRAGGIAQHVGIEGERNSCCECLDQDLVRPPGLRAVQAPARHDEPDGAIAAQQFDNAANPLRRRHEPVEECDPPRVTVNPMRAPLRVHLEDRVVVVEEPGAGEVDERPEIATEVRDPVDHRVWQPRGDLGLEHLGAAFDQRDHEVVRLRNPDEPILEVEPDLGVVDVRHHEYPGVRRRAFKAWVPTTGCELRARQQRAGGCHEPSGWRHLGRKEPSGAEGGRRRVFGKSPGELPDPAAGQASSSGDAPHRRRDSPRRRGEEAFHLAPVLISRRFQMGDPDQERFVLLAQRVEKIVRLHRPPHAGDSIQTSARVHAISPAGQTSFAPAR